MRISDAPPPPEPPDPSAPPFQPPWLRAPPFADAGPPTPPTKTKSTWPGVTATTPVVMPPFAGEKPLCAGPPRGAATVTCSALRRTQLGLGEQHRQRGGVTKRVVSRNRGCSSLHATCDGVVLGGARVVELDRPTLPRHAAQRGQSRPQRALHNGVCRAGLAGIAATRGSQWPSRDLDLSARPGPAPGAFDSAPCPVLAANQL